MYVDRSMLSPMAYKIITIEGEEQAFLVESLDCCQYFEI
jgi:hypothetical protein